MNILRIARHSLFNVLLKYPIESNLVVVLDKKFFSQSNFYEARTNIYYSSKRNLSRDKGYFCPDCSNRLDNPINGVFACNMCAQKFMIDYWISDILTPKEIYQLLDKYVIGQDCAKKLLSIETYSHYLRINSIERLVKIQSDQIPKKKMKKIYNISDSEKIVYDHSTSNKSHHHNLTKANIILLGPTGSGKTYLVQTLAKIIGVPIVICDCTTLTQAGYAGGKVEHCLSKLLLAANKDAKVAEQGIVFLDEFDKIGRKTTLTRDVGGLGVQQALLKIIEGTKVQVSINPLTKILNTKGVNMDTSNILFIGSGAFNGIDKLVEQRKCQRSIGFSDPKISKKLLNVEDNIEDDEYYAQNDEDNDEINKVKQEIRKKNKLLNEVESKDLMKFGLIPELVGRFPVIGSVNALTEEDLIRILIEPKNNLIESYKEHFAMNKCKLTVTPDALKEIAKMAIVKETGARSLRSILEHILLESRYQVPGSDICEVRLTKESVKNNSAEWYYRDHVADQFAMKN